MAGFKFSTGLGSFAGPGTQPAARTASEAAFGSQYATPSASQGSGFWHPAGVTFWSGVVGLGGLAFVRYSLPSSGSPSKKSFDLAVLTFVLFTMAQGPIKLSLQRLAQQPQTGGLTNTFARAGIFILG